MRQTGEISLTDSKILKYELTISGSLFDTEIAASVSLSDAVNTGVLEAVGAVLEVLGTAITLWEYNKLHLSNRHLSEMMPALTYTDPHHHHRFDLTVAVANGDLIYTIEFGALVIQKFATIGRSMSKAARQAGITEPLGAH